MTSAITISFIVHADYSHINAAIDSILTHTRCKMTLYVTINTGQSSESDALQQRYPQLKFIFNTTPKGFASNHNHIMRLAESPYVALLNDDIIADPYCIDAMVDYIENHPEVGLASPLILRSDGTLQESVYNDPSLLRMIYAISGLGVLTPQGGKFRQLLQKRGIARHLGSISLDNRPITRFVPVVVGVAMFARKQAYEEAGAMDEDTIVYAEEFGWHKRIRDAGWKIASFAQTSVTHLNLSQDLVGWKLAEHRKGILNYYIRYRPKWERWLIRSTIFVSHGVRALVLVFVNPSSARDNRQAARVSFWQPKHDPE